VLVLAVLLVPEPEAGADSMLARAAVRAGEAGPRSFEVEIEFDGPASHRARGVLDLLSRSNARPLVRLETSDIRGGDRAFGWDEAGPWVQRLDGGVDRPEPRSWTRRFLGGTLDLLVDDLPGFLAGLPIDHDVRIEDAADGRPRVIAERRADAASPDGGVGARRGRGPGRPDGGVGGPERSPDGRRSFDGRGGRGLEPPPPGRPGPHGPDGTPPPGPPSLIDLTFHSDTFELAEVLLAWDREPGRRPPPADMVDMAGLPDLGGSRPGGPAPRRIRLHRIEPRGRTPIWYAAPDS